MKEKKLSVANTEKEIPQAIKGVLDLYGKKILDNGKKFYLLLTDVVQVVPAKKILEKVCLNSDLSGLDAKTKELAEKSKNVIVEKLYRDEMISKDISQKALDWILIALGVKSQPKTSTPERKTNIDDFVIENGVLVKYVGEKTSEPVIIPEGVEKIGMGAFVYCSFLTEVVFPNTLKEIGAQAFYGCVRLTKINFPSSLEKIGNQAFETCEQLVEVVVPENVNVIGARAFCKCCALETVFIKGEIDELQINLFYGCDRLRYVVIPSSVTYIAKDAFPLKLNTILFTERQERIPCDPCGGIAPTTLYYREDQPIKKGGFWHYVDGKPEAW